MTFETAKRPRPRWRTRDGWIFACTLVVLAAVPWSVRHWPSQDGPNHLAVAHLLRHYSDAGSPFPRYFDAQGGIRPSTLYYSLLVALSGAVRLGTAQKIAVSLAIVLLPLAGLVFVRRSVPLRVHSALLLLPLAIDWALAMGFVAFVLALVFGIFTLAAAFEHGASPRLSWRLALAGGLFFICVLFHPVTGVLTGIALLLVEGPRLRRMTSWIRVACVTAPATAFLVYSYLRAGSGLPGGPPKTEWADPFQVVCGLAEYHVAYSTWEVVPRGAVMAVLLVLAAKEARARSLGATLRGTDAESAVVRLVGGLLVLYTVLPSVLSDWYYCSARSLVYASFLLPATVDLPHRWVASAAAWCAGLTAAVLCVQLPEIIRLSRDLQNVLDAGADIPRGAKLIPINFTGSSWGPVDKPQPLAHSWAELVIDHDAIAAQFFAAGRPRMGGDRFRTLTFRPGVLAPTGALPWSSNEGAYDLVRDCRDRLSAKCVDALTRRKAALEDVAGHYDYVLMIAPPDFARAALAEHLTMPRHVGIAWLYAVPHAAIAKGADGAER